MAGSNYSPGYPSPGMQDDAEQSAGPASRRYSALWYDREPFLVRARRQSRLTLPFLFRLLGENSTSSEVLPWQSLGAYGVNTASAKLILSMFPPGIPFIKLKPSRQSLISLNEMDADARGKLKAAIDVGLSKVEQDFIDGVEEDGDRFKLFDACRHIVVGGNHGLKLGKDSILQSIKLERYVTIRDNNGTLLEFVIEDGLSYESLPADIRIMAGLKGYDPKSTTADKSIRVYTHGRLYDNERWEIYQECFGERVQGSEQTLNPDVMPYLFLRMYALEKENYGRSYCEDYEADLQTLDGYWQFLTEGGAAMAQTKWLVKPGGVTNKKAFAEAGNGAVITGDAEDVATVKADKQADMQVSMELLEKIESRLSRAFLIVERRTGERVTAMEIQGDNLELDTTLGGVYSNLVVSWQRPYATLKLGALQRADRVTKLPKGSVNVTILTGDAGLGRRKRAQDTDEFLGTAAQLLGEEIVAPYVNVSVYLQRAAANRSIDPDGLIKSEEAVQALQQQQQQAQLTQAATPEVVKQVGGMLAQGQAQASQPGGAPQQQPQGAQ